MQNLTSLLCAALFTVGLIACGGDDGPSDSTKLTSLSAADIKSVCGSPLPGAHRRLRRRFHAHGRAEPRRVRRDHRPAGGVHRHGR
jgi:hypothetical protein